jgi:hypothetical protein
VEKSSLLTPPFVKLSPKPVKLNARLNNSKCFLVDLSLESVLR